MGNLNYYFEFRNKIAKKYGYESWQEMSNRDAKIPDHVITDLVFSHAEEYHQSELLKLNKSDVISSVCTCKVSSNLKYKICANCLNKLTGID